MNDEELITQLRTQDHSEMCLAAANRIEALTEQLAAARRDAEEAEAYALALQAELEARATQ